ncbi:MAG: hypothetical protein IJ092_01450, partial [Atopobiaceae bacterium]|nr:hypothetical protein [Atopobiaceae bacterium]
GNTILRYSDAMERHVRPVLGERDIVSIDRQDAQPVVLAAGTPAEARQTKRSWSAVMGQAVIDGLIPSNPLLGRYEYPVEPDAAIDYEEDPFAAIEGSRRVWDARTALRAMPILMGTAIETAWLACIGAGLRNQEAFALRWKDVRRIEVGGREVTQVAVHHAVTLADGRKRTKTPRSVRRASVAEPFGSRLWALRGDPEEPICRLTLANIRRQWKTMWEPCLSKHARKADRIKGIMVDGVEPPIPYLPLARMRATHETLMQEAGVLDSVNAATHGHSQKVSYRHYLSPEATDAAARLGEMLAETADDA